MHEEKKKGLNISVRSFLGAIAVIFALMVCSYFLTFPIPGGSYNRIHDHTGNLIIDTSTAFTYTNSVFLFGNGYYHPFGF